MLVAPVVRAGSGRRVHGRGRVWLLRQRLRDGGGAPAHWFSFFTDEALASQAGLPTTVEDRDRVQCPSGTSIDLARRPARFFEGGARLADGRLLMIDAITGYWPDAGEAGLGRIRARQTIAPRAWYFKAQR